MPPRPTPSSFARRFSDAGHPRKHVRARGQFAGETTVKVELSTIVEDAVSKLAARPPIRVDLDASRTASSSKLREALGAHCCRTFSRTAQDASQHGQEVVLSAIRAGSPFASRCATAAWAWRRKFWNGWGNPSFSRPSHLEGGHGARPLVSRAMIERLGRELRVSSTLERAPVSPSICRSPLRHLAAPCRRRDHRKTEVRCPSRIPSFHSCWSTTTTCSFGGSLRRSRSRLRGAGGERLRVGDGARERESPEFAVVDLRMPGDRGSRSFVT